MRKFLVSESTEGSCMIDLFGSLHVALGGVVEQSSQDANLLRCEPLYQSHCNIDRWKTGRRFLMAHTLRLCSTDVAPQLKQYMYFFSSYLCIAEGL